ncbi:hypothetical protein Nepgr_004321 [Nepenthes gracilis]|uniref:Uncharacterized protein n=1 Tax=Nepenthes gracilis TaxID=150966 RepID=A0AAD3S1A7_NEPGR|nr:hypothetical protein Nepgr_004321 [Nepenthes gracilis]
MPVILGDESSGSIWLNGPPSSKFNALLLQPYEGPNLVWCPVMPGMGKLTFDGPELLMRLKNIKKFKLKLKSRPMHKLHTIAAVG